MLTVRVTIYGGVGGSSSAWLTILTKLTFVKIGCTVETCILPNTVVSLIGMSLIGAIQ